MGDIYKSPGSLTFANGQFLLDRKPLQIFSGTMHYFRVCPEYWKDRLLKMKACGLNTVETYVCWNLHEEYPGEFDFSGLLNVRAFIQQAGEVGLNVIFRPGPYICAEWDYGGLPSWLLKDEELKVRSNYPPYQQAVKRFFKELLKQIVDLQHSDGGPIIAIQVENEFGSYSDEVDHLLFIKEELLNNGIKELLLTSENIYGLQRAAFYKNALPTVNFPTMEDGKKLFEMIHSWSPEFPLMVMEFWPGWFDHWGQDHKFVAINQFEECLKGILEAGGSFNMYMFHGGTNFGFMAGANYFEGSHYKPDTTSYDYDAPLSEAGDITPKYIRAREIILKMGLKNQGITSLPEPPPNTPKADYGEARVTSFLSFEDVLSCCNTIESPKPIPMEMLSHCNGFGQNFGYVLYRKIIRKGQILSFKTNPKDRAQIFVNNDQVAILDWLSEDMNITLDLNNDADNTLDILVENHGRVNYIEYGSNRLNQERKGIVDDVMLDGEILSDWKIFPLDFKPKLLSSIKSKQNWERTCKSPTVGKCYIDIDQQPKDTFLQMKDWNKGIVIVNGFNLGRYWKIGPTQTLYVPAPILKKGQNEILVFEQHQTGSKLVFSDTPILGSSELTSKDSICYPKD